MSTDTIGLASRLAWSSSNVKGASGATLGCFRLLTLGWRLRRCPRPESGDEREPGVA